MPCLDITHGEVGELDESHHFVCPSGKPRILHLLRCQGVRGKLLQLHPWTPWIYNVGVNLVFLITRPYFGQELS